MEPCRVYKNLLRGSNLGLEAEVVLDTTVVSNVLQVATILDDTVAVTGLEVLLRLMSVKPHFFEMIIFWRPANL